MHEDTLKGIWRKAESLVRDTSLVTLVPGSRSSHHHMVATTSGECPHLVTPTKFTGQFKCDTKCVMYATYKVCSHTVAAAEVNGSLTRFMHWLIKPLPKTNKSFYARNS